MGIQGIDYGLIVKVKGGLADGENAALDINTEFSIPVAKGATAAGPIYDVEKSSIESSLLCPSGKTIIMGGTKQLTEAVNIKSAVPILGSIPVLQFLFSERGHVRDDRQILILVSPQIAKAPIATPALVNETSDTEEKAKKPISILTPKY